jgi:hypothetical protein
MLVHLLASVSQAAAARWEAFSNIEVIGPMFYVTF